MDLSRGDDGAKNGSKRGGSGDRPTDSSRSQKPTYHSVGAPPPAATTGGTPSVPGLVSSAEKRSKSEEEYYQHLPVGPEVRQTGPGQRACVARLHWTHGDLSRSLRGGTTQKSRPGREALSLTSFRRHLGQAHPEPLSTQDTSGPTEATAADTVGTLRTAASESRGSLSGLLRREEVPTDAARPRRTRVQPGQAYCRLVGHGGRPTRTVEDRVDRAFTGEAAGVPEPGTSTTDNIKSPGRTTTRRQVVRPCREEGTEYTEGLERTIEGLYASSTGGPETDDTSVATTNGLTGLRGKAPHTALCPSTTTPDLEVLEYALGCGPYTYAAGHTKEDATRQLTEAVQAHPGTLRTCTVRDVVCAATLDGGTSTPAQYPREEGTPRHWCACHLWSSTLKHLDGTPAPRGAVHSTYEALSRPGGDRSTERLSAARVKRDKEL